MIQVTYWARLSEITDWFSVQKRYGQTKFELSFIPSKINFKD